MVKGNQEADQKFEVSGYLLQNRPGDMKEEYRRAN